MSEPVITARRLTKEFVRDEFQRYLEEEETYVRKTGRQTRALSNAHVAVPNTKSVRSQRVIASGSRASFER